MEIDPEEVNPNFTDKANRDYKLVQLALKKKDRKAYAKLMDNYKDALYFMLLKMTNNADDAEDLTIEAFGKAFKRLNQYTPDYAFSTWLFKIATNNCIDFIRKKKKSVLVYDSPYHEDDYEEEDITTSIKSQDLNPEEKLIREQKLQSLRDIVDKLKPRYRQLVELRYFKEYSYEEIADEMKLPLGTVKAQLFRAREFLLEVIKDSRMS
jgi:RNA polymerase sigma factor (sigma-70 family)